MASIWDSLRSAFSATGTASRARSGNRRKSPAPTSRGRTNQKYGPGGKATRTRAQLEDRANRRPVPAVPFGARVTPMSDRKDRYGGRNYPPQKANVRVREILEGTRSQLAARRANRAAQGYDASVPHRLSGEGARSNVRARGTAPSPARPLPGDPTPVAKNRRNPKRTGRQFAGTGMIGRPPKGLSR